MIKTPITYYGGKQMMLQHILPRIPHHNVYTEAFAGGAAVFWAKEPAKVEVLNDLNGEIVNFYQVLQSKPGKLAKFINATLHSRKVYKSALAIYDTPELFGRTKRAWALWVLTIQGFASKIGTWGFDKSSNSLAKRVMNAKDRFNREDYTNRLSHVQIECNEAHKVIQSRDCTDAFHYVDPPYFNSDCGHYGGYSEANFERDLQVLEKVQGKFLLSSYPSEILTRYAQKNGWYQVEIKKAVAVSKHVKKTKVEVLTANYPI
ncbi:DNA adenine methylase [Rufibacter quisquiliarum]|uniref:DNA adenine methylase n=1 Tax=Rufibacter quisquiliarum TaxID=1549639 RepID=A0A839GJX6_9BACT|nr:DNA adenine methylase [Rufibacter quisquiliarum]MBA9078950.1 DNA adenine methylase [Rufibacter quisquiliarum]